ncbi:hypothetical protein OB919_14605 [Halobacteria archaeon AArc-curdl1]|uniref:DUF7344 domain-containing protein n=1 Tax=Natronosalvus hydrolyticus TaxID=2979988 RepID=A0AAP3E6X1_9EURY|nr:hypothetical protein [Halobacteria archaeon AArc-curdl1]
MEKGSHSQAPPVHDEPATGTTGEEETTRRTSLSNDSVFHILQTSRRRDVLRYLQAQLEDENDDFESVSAVSISDLTEWIAARENNITVEQLRSSQRQRVYISLYQTHLPKLDELNVINYDDDRGLVTPTPTIRKFDRYLEPESPVEEVPAQKYERWIGAYALLTVLSAVVLALAASNLVPFTPLIVGVLIVGTLGVVTAAFAYELSKNE